MVLEEEEALRRELNASRAERERATKEFEEQQAKNSHLRRALGDARSADGAGVPNRKRRRLFMGAAIVACAAAVCVACSACVWYSGKSAPRDKKRGRGRMEDSAAGLDSSLSVTAAPTQVAMQTQIQLQGEIWGLPYEDFLCRRERRLAKRFPWLSDTLCCRCCFGTCFAGRSVIHGASLSLGTLSDEGKFVLCVFSLVWVLGFAAMWHFHIVQPFLKQILVYAHLVLGLAGAITIAVTETYDSFSGMFAKTQANIRFMQEKVDHVLPYLGISVQTGQKGSVAGRSSTSVKSPL